MMKIIVSCSLYHMFDKYLLGHRLFHVVFFTLFFMILVNPNLCLSLIITPLYIRCKNLSVGIG